MTELEDRRSFVEVIQELVKRFLPKRYLKRRREEFESKATKTRAHVINQLDDAIDNMRTQFDETEQRLDQSPPSTPGSFDSESVSCKSPRQAGITSETTIQEVEIFDLISAPQPCTSPSSSPPATSQSSTEDHGESIDNHSDSPQLQPATQESNNGSELGKSTQQVITETDNEESHSTLPAQSQCPLMSLSTVLNYEEPPLRKMKFENDYAIYCDGQHISHMQHDKLHLIARNSTFRNDVLKTYNLLNHSKSAKEINLTSKTMFCADIPYVLFHYRNDISLLTGRKDINTLHLNLYHIDTKAACASWEPVPFSRYSISSSLFDLGNCIPVSHRDDGVIVVSALNDRVKGNHCIVFHIFSQKASGRNWKATSSLLPIKHKFNHNVYQIQSCIIDPESKHMYCSLILHETGAFVYKFDLTSLLKHRRGSNSVSIKPVNSWRIEEPTLQNCFLSSLRGETVMISINHRNIIKVKRPINFLPALPADYKFELSSKIKITRVSIISNSKVIILYHENKTKECFIKTISI